MVQYVRYEHKKDPIDPELYGSINYRAVQICMIIYFFNLRVT